jgi:hypothetical protein
MIQIGDEVWYQVRNVLPKDVLDPVKDPRREDWPWMGPFVVEQVFVPVPPHRYLGLRRPDGSWVVVHERLSHAATTPPDLPVEARPEDAHLSTEERLKKWRR